MGESLKSWMMIAVGVIVIVAVIYGAAVSRVENKQKQLDTQINAVQVPTATGTCVGC